jgi:hypothetical protein
VQAGAAAGGGAPGRRAVGSGRGAVGASRLGGGADARCRRGGAASLDVSWRLARLVTD